MNEYLPRTSAVSPSISATERSTPPVRGVIETKVVREDGNGAGGRNTPSYERERSAAAADYAKIQADISDVLAELQPSTNSADATTNTDRAIMALMPNPVVMLPLPPTDENMIAFVAQVGQAMARQAAQAHAAQASVTPIMMEAAAH